MDGFIEREHTREARFQHDQLLQYKILARRNRLFGLWAAQLLDMPQEQAESYARSMACGSLCTIEGTELIEKIMADLSESHIDIKENRARKQLDYFYEDASMQLHKE